MIKLFNVLLIITVFSPIKGEWKPVGNHIKTRWAATLTPENAWREYPRPDLVRSNWVNLNGLWDYTITGNNAQAPSHYDGQILVPFPVESSLSGVGKAVDANNILWYHRTFITPKHNDKERVHLNFEAVDYHTQVMINNKHVGQHTGGYDPFTFDITEFLDSKQSTQTIVVKVTDSTEGFQPRGKQTLKPSMIYYTSTTGIWQTVWLEVVPQHHVDSLKVITDIDKHEVTITVESKDSFAAEVSVIDKDNKHINKVKGNTNEPIIIQVPDAKLWDTKSPYLYTLSINASDDLITSYFGMRKLDVQKDNKGINRFFLNNKPIFLFGPLDQGFWPDGIYTPPSETAMVYDLEMTQKLGFNTIRKHVKVEPRRWYYWTDKMGILVWQDFPSVDDGTHDTRPLEQSKQIETEMEKMVKSRFNYPSIVVWVPFNEGWGQYDTARVVHLFKNWDHTRLVNEASGWTNYNVSNILDHHSYVGLNNLPLAPYHVTALGEYGGGFSSGLPKEHVWDPTKSFVNQKINSPEKLQKFFLDKLASVRANAIIGLGAAIYTQTTDVENEINGLLTYDRAENPATKLSNINEIHRAISTLNPIPSVASVIVPSAKDMGKDEWKYTTINPQGNWYQTNFDDSHWKTGPGGFGTKGTRGAVIHTEWNTPDIWLRRTFDITHIPKHPHLYLYYDEIAHVFINGIEVFKDQLTLFEVTYGAFELDNTVLKMGKNTIAIQCHQISGGQGIDAGIIDACYDDC